ncbi:MAG: response regulator [Dehalococcoidales bacterium]|nr:response regulator [Dehalococcoidales bacterium]
MSIKILSVEDDPSYSRYLGFMLTKEGYEVIAANNGLTGFRKAQEEKPDLIILDVMLPGLDGFTICHRLRNEIKMTDVPIIILSAKGQDADKNEAIRVGANIFLNKPVDREVLLNTIKSLLPAKS